MRRLFAMALALLCLGASPPRSDFAQALPGTEFAFPRDHGAHPAFRTEWWYVTGWLDAPGAQQLGFQVTFFRTRTGIGEDNPSRFAPRQILFAHAALSDPREGRLLHDSRAARAGFGLAYASTNDADVAIGDWTFRRLTDGRFTTRITGGKLDMDLQLVATQPPLPQGDGGFSRKGRDPGSASLYYSVPQLKVTGTVRRAGRSIAVTGSAWLDREWSSSYLEEGAVGWDWTGLNLDDGGALMAFRIRGRDGGTLWAGGSWRDPAGHVTTLGRADVRFDVRRRWTSPRTGAIYPVDPVVRVRLPTGERSFALAPLFDDQELDSRTTGGPVYWEGAVRTSAGSGYLELTGYAEDLAF